jgi:acyl dehydratase
MTSTVGSIERWCEDYPEGAIFDIGEIAVDEQEVLDFARRFDPQPFHTDPVAAAASHFGGIIASGWHTASLMMRLLATNFLSPVSSLGSPGVDELRWLRPVRPGDVLRGSVTVLSARRSASKPDRGLIESRIEMHNQQGELVFSTRAVSLLRCRGAA